jgi:hypothetical protein
VKNIFLLHSCGLVSIGSLTASCVVGGGGFLGSALQINSLLFGLSYCYYGDRNPIRILGDLKIRVSELQKSRKQLIDECEALQANKQGLHSLQAIELLIAEKEKALENTEARYFQQWKKKEEELSKRTSEIEKFLEDEKTKINQLSVERSQSLDERETLIQQELERINEELETDKKQFLEEHNRAIASLEDEIDFLKAQLQEAEAEIQRYDFPRMPEGVSREDIAARRIIEILRDCKLICDFRGAWIENGFILVRVRPRRGGEKEIQKWANRFQMEMDLQAIPEISTQSGAIQLRLLPNDVPYTPPRNEPISPDDEPDGDKTEPLHDFIEPKLILDPMGPIRPLERRWVLWLWTHHNPPIRNKANVIRRVYGATNGGKPEKFRAGRERLHIILSDAGVEFRVQPKKAGQR